MAVPWVKQARSLGITARHSLGLICIPALGRTPSPILGARHQKEIRGINGAGEVSSRPSERRNRKINNQVRESERRTAQRIRAQSCSRVRPSNPSRNKRDPHLP